MAWAGRDVRHGMPGYVTRRCRSSADSDSDGESVLGRARAGRPAGPAGRAAVAVAASGSAPMRQRRLPAAAGAALGLSALLLAS